MSSADSSAIAEFPGLGRQWDQLSIVRDRLKDLQCVMVNKPLPGEKEEATKGAIAKTHGNLRHNSEIMVPLLTMMKDHRDKYPCKDALAAELKVAFERSRLQPDWVTLNEEAWSVRYMYGLVKQLTYKRTPPRETQLCLNYYWFALYFLVFFMFHNMECVGEQNEDPIFQQLLSVWGVDLKNWKQVQPKKVDASGEASASEASLSPPCSTCATTPQSPAAESPAAEVPVSATGIKKEPDASKDKVCMWLHVF